ncbi:MAG TPA: hypothetical protein VII92_13125 [Anaerolineae bacterium]
MSDEKQYSDERSGVVSREMSVGEKQYFIVNPDGAIHQVLRPLARDLLRQQGYRMATRAEIQALADAGGRQIPGEPLAAVFAPTLDDAPDAVLDADPAPIAALGDADPGKAPLIRRRRVK